MAKNNPPQGKVIKVTQVPVHVKPTVKVPVTVQKTVFTRKNLPDGDFMMNFYYIRDAKGNLVPEDIEKATHYERIIYDRNGNVIGSTLGRMGEGVNW